MSDPTIVENPVVAEEKAQEESHPLSSYWTLWSHVVTTNKRSPLGPIFDFNTVEEFWTIYNSLKAPSAMTGRVDLLFFRSEPNLNAVQTSDLPVVPTQQFNRIHPEWEDANNLGGGEYRINISGIEQDKQWELTVLAILGGSLELSEDVAGVWLACGRRNGNTLSIWKKTSDEQTTEHSIQQLGDAWVNLLKKANVQVLGPCTYISHQNALLSTKNKEPAAPEFTWP